MVVAGSSTIAGPGQPGVRRQLLAEIDGRLVDALLGEVDAPVPAQRARQVGAGPVDGGQRRLGHRQQPRDVEVHQLDGRVQPEAVLALVRGAEGLGRPGDRIVGDGPARELGLDRVLLPDVAHVGVAHDRECPRRRRRPPRRARTARRRARRRPPRSRRPKPAPARRRACAPDRAGGRSSACPRPRTPRRRAARRPRAMPSSRASATACMPPPPPKAISVNSRGSKPRLTETSFSALTMLALAIADHAAGRLLDSASSRAPSAARRADASSMSAAIAPAAEVVRVDAAGDQIGVGRRSARCRRGRRRPGRARRRRCAARHAACRTASTQAMLPPPLPISTRSSTGTLIG